MAAKDDVWTAVVARYDSASLVSLTNINDRNPTSINTTAGTEAANGTLNLWPAYAQVDFDVSDGLHMEVAVRGTIAMLFERGGSASAIAKVEWDEVFSNEGLIARVRRTGPRARQGPSTNSGVTTTAENVGGRNKKGWSDRDNIDFMRPRDELSRF